MRVLVACEESQAVCIAFREKGNEAYSCDILPPSGGHPEWHIQDDAIVTLYSQEWDLVVAHPPCTRLANSGVRWLAERNLWQELDKARDFFLEFVIYGHEGGTIAIENPIPHKHANLPPYAQIIHPWQFGHPETKATCLWLYGLPKLQPTNIVEGREGRIWKMPPSPERTRLRSQTYPGIAKALANQYGAFIDSGLSLLEWNKLDILEKNRTR